MRNQRDTQPLILDVDKSQADAVHRDRSLRHHLRRQRALCAEPEHCPWSVAVDPFEHAAAVDVPLDEMSAEARIRRQCALQIDALAPTQTTKICTSQSLWSGFEDPAVLLHINDGQTTAVDGHAVADRGSRH